jgi:hypothetical protein
MHIQLKRKEWCEIIINFMTRLVLCRGVSRSLRTPDTKTSIYFLFTMWTEFPVTESLPDLSGNSRHLKIIRVGESLAIQELPTLFHKIITFSKLFSISHYSQDPNLK